MTKQARQPPLNYRKLRNGLMFVIGAGGFIHEILVTHGERPTIALFCLLLMGVPVMMHKDEQDK